MLQPLPNETLEKEKTVDHSHLWPGVTAAVREEIATLQSKGIDVQLVDPGLRGHFQLDPDTQARVDAAIEERSQVPGFAKDLFDPAIFPAAAAWHGVAKRAIALNGFYRTGEAGSPSVGIDPECIDWRIIGGKSAKELLAADYTDEPAKLDRILEKYANFFGAGDMRKDGPDRYGLSSHDYIAGAVDRIADVTRALVAGDMIVEHALEKGKGREIVSASLACGAAEPVMWIAKQLEAAGVTVAALHHVDSDPVALAASVSAAINNGVEDKVQIHRKNILKTPIEDYLGDGVDYIDLIGLFEYLPRSAAKYTMAANLLGEVSKVVRPGGMIVFGNMLNDRPQQKWFEGIWPALQQRSITEVLDIIDEAGLGDCEVSVRVPENEGVYALYGIKIPESGFVPPKLGFLQRRLAGLVLRNMPEY